MGDPLNDAAVPLGERGFNCVLREAQPVVRVVVQWAQESRRMMLRRLLPG
jgi:hypothetical protein